MNLKSLVHRELGEGLTEKELASMVGVPVGTIAKILIGELPNEPAIWEKFARYFLMDIEFLRTGTSAKTRTMVELPGGAYYSAAGEIRKIPLLHWQHIHEMVHAKSLPGLIHAEAVIEATDVSGTRTFALKVKDDSMEPLFSEGEMIFVNPDSEWKPGDYVIANNGESNCDAVLLRQVKHIGNECMLHPLNRKYEDLPLANENAVWGKIVRLRKNL
ncbi:MAG TPA: LexA family transcriptional regulator [Nitrospira sp.]|nr:LexA family transcriptional regulator [Nitrospira sp.]